MVSTERATKWAPAPRAKAAAETGCSTDPVGLTLDTVTIGSDGVSEADLVVHDETNRTLATMLAALETPVALGVLYCDPAPSYETSIR